jgi:hypothetical protein
MAVLAWLYQQDQRRDVKPVPLIPVRGRPTAAIALLTSLYKALYKRTFRCAEKLNTFGLGGTVFHTSLKTAPIRPFLGSLTNLAIGPWHVCRRAVSGSSR